VPAIDTLEKLAHAMEVPMYQLFYDGEKPPTQRLKLKEEHGWGSSGSDARTLDKFRRLLGRTDPADQKLLLYMATKMARSKRSRKSA
jgi:hypothetical protein